MVFEITPPQDIHEGRPARLTVELADPEMPAKKLAHALLKFTGVLPDSPGYGVGFGDDRTGLHILDIR